MTSPSVAVSSRKRSPREEGRRSRRTRCRSAPESQALTSKSVEITTNFTIGGAVEQAASELRQFYASQWACADVQLAGNTLTVEYGAHGVCPYNSTSRFALKRSRHARGRLITKNEASEVVVDHEWTNLSNGVVEVNGTAEVTWSATDKTRHVTHDLSWTRLADQRTGAAAPATYVQKPLAAVPARDPRVLQRRERLVFQDGKVRAPRISSSIRSKCTGAIPFLEADR